MKHYVGLDVSMKETFICILDETGQNVAQGKTKTDPEMITEYIKKFNLQIENVGIESGSLSHWLLVELQKLGIPATCIDARKMATILSIQINKTDKNDAHGIAEAMRCRLYREVIAKSQSSIEIGILMGSRKLLVQQKVQLTNSIRGFLKIFGIRLGSTGDASFIQKVKGVLSNKYTIACDGIESLLLCYDKILEELKKLTRNVEKLTREDEVTRRLMTIPGIGAITALSYKIEIDNPQRFKNSRSVGAYLGMTPRQYSSGEIVRQGRISKCGSSETRTLLNEAAVVLLTRSQKWSRLKIWGLKIKRKHGFKKAAMAVGRKLAVIMHHMWIDKTDFIFGESKEQKKEEIIKTM